MPQIPDMFPFSIFFTQVSIKHIDVKSIVIDGRALVIKHSDIKLFLFPVPALSAAFGMTDEDFQTEYGFSKPRQDHALAVYCRSGVRAKTAVEILQTMGYTKYVTIE